MQITLTKKDKLNFIFLRGFIHVQEIFATLYHNLGIDTSQQTIVDTTGRPQYLVEHPYLKELV